jgi:hypothetical protein
MTDQQGYEEEQGKGGGSGFLKFCLICGCLLFLLLAGVIGFGAYQASQMLTMDPVKVVAKVEGDILPGSKVPPGYEGMMGMKIPGVMEMAIVVPQGMRQQTNQNNLPLMMMISTIPPGQNAEQMKLQMQQAMAQQGGGGANTQIQVEAQQQVTVKVRGQDVVVNEMVGADQNGVKMKQLVMMVPRSTTSSDLVFIMFMGKADVFDQAAVDAFLASIR